MAATPQARRRRPGLALAATVIVAAGILAGLSFAVPAPRILSDELRYTLAASSLAEGDGLAIRGHEYEFGPLYPVLLAGVLAVEPNREIAYPLFKLLNALLFALVAVPVYLLARRLLPPRWSLGVAALSLAVPSSVYVSLVMTESAAYLAASTAVLAIVLALERPTWARQAAALGLIGIAVLVRPQFVVLGAAYLAALPLQLAIAPASRPTQSVVRAYWPTLGAVVLGLAAFAAVPIVTGGSYTEQLGAYHDLWGEYDPVAVARWVAHHLAALELYLAVVPLAVAPIVIPRLVLAARAGSARRGAFVSAFLTVNASLVLVAAAFSSTRFGFDRLHDRYLFYVAPLWLVVLAIWLHEGLPRPVVAGAIGVALAVVLPAYIPFAQLSAVEGGDRVDAVVTILWSRIHDAVFAASPDHLSGRRVLAVFVIAILVVLVALPSRLRLVPMGIVAVVLVAASGLAWADARDAGSDAHRVLGEEATWVDRTVGARGDVLSLYVAPCTSSTPTRLGLLLSEFFNRSVVDSAHLVHPDGSLLPSAQVRISTHGVLRRESGEPLRARYVLTPPGMRLDGRMQEAGTRVPLLLWEVGGIVRAVGGRRSAAIERGACSASE